MFEFKVFIDDDDYIQFNKYQYLNNPVDMKTLILYKFSIPLLCFLFITRFIAVQASFQAVIYATISMILFSIFWVLYCKEMFLLIIENRIKRMKRSGRLLYSDVGLLKFDDEIIHEITPEAENKAKYSLVEKIAVTEKAVYIYISSLQAYILPTVAFTDDKEKQIFLEFLKMKCVNAIIDRNGKCQ